MLFRAVLATSALLVLMCDMGKFSETLTSLCGLDALVSYVADSMESGFTLVYEIARVSFASLELP